LDIEGLRKEGRSVEAPEGRWEWELGFLGLGLGLGLGVGDVDLWFFKGSCRFLLEFRTPERSYSVWDLVWLMSFLSVRELVMWDDSLWNRVKPAEVSRLVWAANLLSD
jgi:hypothetical protein